MSLERRESLRPDAALESLFREFASCAVAPTRTLIETYVRGQLGGLPRKSVMPIAREAGIPPRTLQELLSLHRWDEGRVRDLLQRRAARALSSRPARGVVLEVSYPKKGRMTPGVERQVRPETGRAENCVRVLHLILTDGAVGCLLDSAVYLPDSWTRDPERLRHAGVPPDVGHRSPSDLGREMAERARSNGVAPGQISTEAIHEIPPSRVGRIRQGSGPISAADAAGLGAGREEVVQAGAAWRVASTPFTPEGDEGPRMLLGFQEIAVGEPRYFLLEGTGEGAARLLERVLARGEARTVFERLRQRLGLGHFEVRAYRSLRRHFTLSSIGTLFLAEGAHAPGLRPTPPVRASEPAG